MRPEGKNDLEDYLAEVEDGLFCVPEEDRECLLRDLKAHVRDLTTDPDGMRTYTGRYGITREQLISELGDPDEVVVDYVASTRHVPSTGMRALIYFLMGFFVMMATIGVGGLISTVANHTGPSAGVLMADALLAGGGIGLLLMTWWVRRDFPSRHRAMPLIVVIFSFASFPMSYQSMATVASVWREIRAPSGQTAVLMLLSFDLLAIALLGLYISIRHIAVISAADARR